MDIRLTKGIKTGAARGWAGYLWLLKILIPISFGTALLVYSGWLYKLDFLIKPAMGFFHLPASAALPLIIGLLTGIYGAIAAMAVMPLSVEHMTLIAVFLLISHNLIQESIIQDKSGFNGIYAALFRLMASIIVTWIAALIIAPEATGLQAGAAQGTHGNTLAFWALMKQWALDTTGLAVKIFCIIMPLLMGLELMKEFNLISRIVEWSAPILSLMGLSKTTGLLWITAAFFGLAYGAAVLVEETKANTFPKDDLLKFHLSIGINHAMIEDPALFLPLGILPVWLWIPRLVAAIIAIYALHLFNLIRRRYALRAGHKKLCNHR